MSQDVRSARKNAEFFSRNEVYAERVARLDTYRNISAVIDREVSGMGRLLDVGNGGVFDYDTSLVDRIVAVDLFLDQLSASDVPPNVELLQGDALALDIEEGGFDGALLALVIHHLVGERQDELVDNARLALDGAWRALRSGGRLLVVESCVAPWFHSVEKVLFRPLALLARTPWMRHPATMQLPAGFIAGMIGERFDHVRIEKIPVGRWIMQFGVRWPTALTPARPYLLAGVKP
jgi:SAM-dependent methyltransferase